jgi:hypothetical protein
MEWELKEGILVPKAAIPPMCAFIDEAYLLGQTGFLQAAVVVPQDVYTQQLVPQSKALLTKLGKEAKEFKGSAIKPGNADVYLEFLQGFINVAAHLGDVAPVYSIIAIDSADVYSSDPFTAIHKNVAGAFAKFGITDEEHLAAEFSRQILWLHVHFPYIAEKGFANPLVLCFDNKHRYAQRMQALKAFTGPRLTTPTFWQLEKAFRSFANTLFQHLTPKIAIPRIERFRFQWSSVEFGLQAADLLCHLALNSVRHGMGIVNDTTILKTELLKKVVPSFALPDGLKAELAVGKDAEAKDDVRCINPKLRSRAQLLPG